MLGFLIAMVIIGVIAGYLGRLLVPGRQPMSVAQTIGLGIIGSFVGGFLGYVLFDKDIEDGALQTSGIVGAVIGTVIVLVLYNARSNSRRPRRRHA
jgi:uncharacterized membrane protein YeaQ/YmgE (transglycosylase-associated protein family)